MEFLKKLNNLIAKLFSHSVESKINKYEYMNYKNINSQQLLQIATLGQLKATGYEPKSVKQELRDNLITKLRNKEEVFPGIWGYEETVIPDMQRAILSMHHINLLGLRGQAKTRLARMLVELLDEDRKSVV